MSIQHLQIQTAIATIGPTGSGKTDVAFELARTFGAGEVINLDKIYTYRGFSIGSGFSDTKKYSDVPKHLYELLEPDEPVIPPEKFISMVRETASDILFRGGVPILEGGSMTYVPELFRQNVGIAKFVHPIIGLCLSGGVDVAQKFRKRIDTAFQEGLLDEVQEGLKTYRNTLIMTDCHAIVPLVRHLDGEITLEIAKEEMLKRLLMYAEKQTALFRSHKEVMWIEHDSSNLLHTVERIRSMLKSTLRTSHA